MEFLQSIQNALPSLDQIQQTSTTALSAIMSFDPPIPDAALIAAFALLVYAIKQNARATSDQARTDIDALYQSELLTANRRAQQARGDLRKAQLEIERERQKRRREAIQSGQVRTRKARLVDITKAKAQHA